MKRNFVLIFFMLLVSGCSSSDKILNRAYDVASTPKASGKADFDKRAQRISEELVKLDEIDKANVIITGNTAIVAIGLSQKPDDSVLISAKRKVEREVKRIDSSVEHVTVTAATELLERIEELGGATNKKEENGYGLPFKGNQEIFRIIPTV